MCVIILSNDLQRYQTFLCCDNLAFTFYFTSTNFGFLIAVNHYSMARHISNDVFIKVNFTGIGNTAFKCIPVTFVRVTACKIWWITCHISFISLIIIKETSAGWNRPQGYILSWLNNKAGNHLISCAWTAEHKSSLCNMIPVCHISKTKNHSRRFKYLQYISYICSGHKCYFIAWSCWAISMLSVSKNCYWITYSVGMSL